MSDGSISQDEIDALLSGIDMGAPTPTVDSTSSSGAAGVNTVAMEFLSSSVPGLKNNLASMTGKNIQIDNPVIIINNREAFLQRLPEMVVATTIDFSSGLKGDHVFAMTPGFCESIVSLVNNEEKSEVDDMALSVISETVSQYVGSEITALEELGINDVANNPAESLHVPKAMVRLPQNEFPVFEYTIKLDGSEYKLWEVITQECLNSIVQAIQGPGPSDVHVNQGAGQMSQSVGGSNIQMNQGMNMGQMNMGQMPQGSGFSMNSTAQPVNFPPLQNSVTDAEQGNIGLIMDVYMELTVELGRTKRMVKEILGMGEGHIIALDKLAGESVDILVNHKPIAKGEVVVIDENFGVRVTEILSPSERVADLT